MTTVKSEYPRTYREQRLAERRAKEAREQMLLDGRTDMPPVCGWTYMTRRPRAHPAGTKYKPVQVICYRVAGSNTDHQGRGYCDYHEVDARRAENNPQLAGAIKHATEQAKFFGNAIAQDPHTVLMNEISRSAQVVAWYEEKLAKLREDGTPDDEILRDWSKQNGYKPSVWIELYNDERKFLVDVCTRAIKAGVAERKVRIAEQQGRMIAAMMMAFLHDKELALSPTQLMAAPAIVRKHLMNMPHEAEEIVLDPTQVMLTARAATKRRSKQEIIETTGTLE